MLPERMTKSTWGVACAHLMTGALFTDDNPMFHGVATRQLTFHLDQVNGHLHLQIETRRDAGPTDPRGFGTRTHCQSGLM